MKKGERIYIVREGFERWGEVVKRGYKDKFVLIKFDDCDVVEAYSFIPAREIE